MPKNFDDTTDDMVNAYLASLPTPNKLWIVLFDENKASVATSDTYGDLTQSTTQKIGVTSVTCVDRVIDLGGPHVFTGTTETPSSVGILTDDPAASPELFYLEDIDGGDPYSFAVSLALSLDVVMFRQGFEGET